MKFTISDITGKPMVMLGGPFVHLQRVTGDIVSEFKWHDGEPVVILYRAVPTTKTGAYMIELKDAHLYAASNGMPTPKLFHNAIEACRAIGFYDDSHAVRRMMDIILDGMPDLIAMPPEPKASEDANRPAADGDELTIKLDGKTIAEVVV